VRQSVNSSYEIIHTHEDVINTNVDTFSKKENDMIGMCNSDTENYNGDMYDRGYFNNINYAHLNNQVNSPAQQQYTNNRFNQAPSQMISHSNFINNHGNHIDKNYHSNNMNMELTFNNDFFSLAGPVPSNLGSVPFQPDDIDETLEPFEILSQYDVPAQTHQQPENQSRFRIPLL